MRALMLSVAVLALMAPAAYAQSTNAAAPPQVEGPGQYMVFFPWNQATLRGRLRSQYAGRRLRFG
jgi:hypothetical protein